MEFLVSVIMPVYNVQKYLAKAINSVLEQTYQNFEIIIVDDGSPDQSYDIAKKYQKQDSRIVVVQKENGGLSDARNYGMKFAKGEYLYFFDSDDTIESNLLELVVKSANQKQSDIIYFGYNVVVEDSMQNIVSTRKILPDINSNDQMVLDYSNDNFYQLLGYAWNKLYKKSFIDKHGFIFQKGLSLVEDIEFNQRVFGKTNEISYCPFALYNYIQRPRMTLVNSYYENYFVMKLDSIKYREKITRQLGYSEDISNRYYKKNLPNIYKSSLNNLFYSSQENKKEMLKIIISHPVGRELDMQITKKPAELLFLYLIKNRKNTMLYIIYSLKSKKNK
ncbi:MAG: glycosyltransferase family 2 protein [Culicoidibacterales bacterium]